MRVVVLCSMILLAANFGLQGGCEPVGGACVVPDAPAPDAGASPAACSVADGFARLVADAQAGSERTYTPPDVPACPELDRPPDGRLDAVGLVFEEYSALITPTVAPVNGGKFFDDGTWWLKALPRGEALKKPLTLFAEGCTQVQYNSASYNYAATRPPVNPVPSCGRYLVGLQVGHRMGLDQWPGVLQLEGAAYARLVPLLDRARMGSSYRVLTENAARQGETFPVIRRMELTGHDTNVLRFIGSVDARSVAGAFQAVLKPGTPTELSIQMRLFPRVSPWACSVRLGLGAFSSMFWKGAVDTPANDTDEAHDADSLSVEFTDGTARTVALANPNLPADGQSWAREVISKPSTSPRAIHLRQTVRDGARYAAYASARYADRPSMSVEQISASVPVLVELATARATDEYIDNVVVNLAVDTSAPEFTSPRAIDVSYVIKATLP